MSKHQYIHKPTGILFYSETKNKDGTKFRTNAKAIFAVDECEVWEANYPMLAIAMPPEVGQVVMKPNGQHSNGLPLNEHVFRVVRRGKDESGQKNLYYGVGKHEFYPMDDCITVTDAIIFAWVDAIAAFRDQKETSPEYQTFINRVPEPIRDLCIIRSFNKNYDFKRNEQQDKDTFF